MYLKSIFNPIFYIVVVWSLSIQLTLAEEENNWAEDALEYLGSSESVDVADGNIDWGVLPGPFSNPEQGFGIGVAVMGLYAPQGENTGNQLSTINISGYVSTAGTYGVGLTNSTYLNQDSIKLNFTTWISQTPSQFWGIGREAAEESSNKTEHEALYFNTEPSISFQFAPNFYFLTGLDYTILRNQKSNGSSLTKKNLEDKNNVGLIFGLEYDSRDFIPTPYKGRYLLAEYRTYSKKLSSDYDYQQLTLNYREFIHVNKSNILAADFFIQGLSDEDNLPWFAMSKMGGDERMRGYYSGQYRDRIQASAQLEYRYRFNNRHGIVTWVGAGNIGSKMSELTDTKWLPTYGVGYRFAFKPRVNVRLDFGFGNEESAVYFNINEAF